MQFLGASSEANMTSGGSGAAGLSGRSFAVQGPGAAQFSGAADILQQVEQLMVKAQIEKTIATKN